MLQKNKNIKPKNKSFSSIFVVDDDPLYLHLLGFHLKKNTDCKIYCYPTGEECLKNLEIDPSIIILDYFLNSTKKDTLDGLGVLKKIKQLKPRIPIIMLSSQKKLNVATASLRSGAYSYLVKDTGAVASVIHIVNVLCNKMTDSF
jgi:CheY-like chemotaxis protein